MPNATVTPVAGVVTSPPTVKLATPPKRFVTFFHPVNAQSVRALIHTITEIVRTERVRSIGLVITTPGGDVNEGVFLYNALRSLNIEIVTYNIGNVDSIGNVVFLAGARRVASQSATFMFHGVNWEVKQPMAFSEQNVREILHVVVGATARIKSLIGSNTMLNEQQLNELFAQASTKDVTYAQQVGIVHEIGDPPIPSGDAITHSPAA